MPTDQLPTYVATIIVAVDLAMACLVYLGVTRLAARPPPLAAEALDRAAPAHDCEQASRRADASRTATEPAPV